MLLASSENHGGETTSGRCSTYRGTVCHSGATAGSCRRSAAPRVEHRRV